MPQDGTEHGGRRLQRDAEPGRGGSPALKVLHVLPFPGVGGTEVATRRVAEAVRASGIESHALLLQDSAELRAYLDEADIPHQVARPRPEPSLARELGRFVQEARGLARVIAGFDILHCADVSAAYHVAVAGRLARRPVLCHVRNREAVLPWRSRVFIGAATHFAFVSENTAQMFPMRIAPTRRSVLYDGLELQPRIGPAARTAAAAALRGEFGLPLDSIVASMFARVNPQKDYDTLIRAAVLLRDRQPRVRFLVVGDHEQVARNRQHFVEVQAAARAAGVLDRIVFAGFRSDTHRLMVGSDFCLLCTHFEGLPLVLIEAMAAGRACVATRVDGIPEVVADGATGLLHEHGDAEGLAAAVARLADDPALAEAMGERGRRDAEHRFSQARFAHDLRDLYAKLARGLPRGVQAVEPAIGEDKRA